MEDSITDISLIIKTFERQVCLERLLSSIRDQGYGQCPVLVADDSRDPYRDAILAQFGDLVDEYIVLPFNSGVSKGRNELLDRVRTEYFIINDEDFIYSDITRLKQAKAKIQEHDLDIIGGFLLEENKEYVSDLLPRRMSEAFKLYWQEWEESCWVADIEETTDRGVVLQSSPPEPNSFPYQCDLTLQFFLARTHSVRDVVGGWNPKLKTTGEHWEFFYRCKEADLRVAFSEDLGAYHLPEDNNTYKKFRYENEREMIIASLQEHGLKYLDRGDDVFYNPEFTREE